MPRAALRLSFPVALAGLCLMCAACSRDPGFAPPLDAVRLPIADRAWAPGAPPEGWCGEASVQMVALHFGVFVPQAVAHALGRPAHVDLWEDDLPTALRALGLEFETFEGRGEAALLTFTVGHLRRGHPVILGVKLVPSPHPQQAVDHLMPAVGFGPGGLVVDTNFPQGQQAVPWAALRARDGLSLSSPQGRQFAWAVTGPGGVAGTRPVSVQVAPEQGQPLDVEVRVEGLEAGRAYRLLQRNLDGGLHEATFVADAGVHLTRVTVPATEAAVFSCEPRPNAAGP